MLAPWSRREVIMGVRPEYVAEDGDIMLRVSTNENLGMNTLVHGHLLDGDKITGKFRGWCDYKVGDSVRVRFTRRHFFDKETTNAIRKEAEA